MSASKQAEIERDLRIGLGHLQAGRYDAAESALLRVQRRDPRQSDAIHLLGVISHQRGRPARAIQLIGQALRLRPAFPEALTNLARAQRAVGDAAAAADNARQAVALAPGLAEAHIQLGRALLDLEDIENAAESCRRAVALAPRSLDAQVNLGAALTRLDDYAGAAQAYQAALRLKPDRVETLTDFGAVLTKLNHHQDALRCHERATALAPKSARAHAGHAATLKAAQDVAGSAEACRRSLALEPDNAEILLLLGSNLAALGRFEEAIACHRRVLELKPDRAEARRRMVAAGERFETEADMEQLRATATSDTIPPQERIAACFALGSLKDKAGAFDEAFQYIETANRLTRAGHVAEGHVFDRVALTRQVDEIMDAFSREFIQAAASHADPTELPVFVVGMPRSGTTLVEQILASHALVAGAGELRDIGGIAIALGFGQPSSDRPEWDPTVAQREAANYLGVLRTCDGNAVRITDKMPDNIFWLGLIACLFPGARVIFCRRDPRDICLSCYFQSFGAGLSWSNDLEDCAFRAQEVDRLWRHWQGMLPLRMLELRYETLVGDLEGQSRRLIDFVGLPWDPACLAFHQTARQVMTASLWQVRQPLYASSVGRWRHYRSHLGSLLAGLAGILPAEDGSTDSSGWAGGCHARDG